MKTNRLYQAVYKTLIYSDLFNAPLSKHDLHKYLYRYAISQEKFFSMLTTIPFIQVKNNYVVLRGRESLFAAYAERIAESEKKLHAVASLIKVLGYIPTILMIGVSGSVAAKNATKHADIDLFIITRHHTLWFTRVLVTVILFIANRKRKVSVQLAPDSICTNMWMSEKHCKLSEQNIFLAREIAQMQIVCDKADMYARFIQHNSWVKKYFPNIPFPLTKRSDKDSVVFTVLLLGLNYLLFVLQHWYMHKRITKEKVSLHAASFHPKDVSNLVLQTYNARLKTYRESAKKSSSHSFITHLLL